jgi:predicted N-acyltransferase
VQEFNSNNYVIQVHASMHAVSAPAWDALLALQIQASPFMQHAYLAAMQDSASASAETGWVLQLLTLCAPAEQGAPGALHAACALYIKSHSYGEYVFDWAWTDAYQRHGLRYYPKAIAAVPFTPVPGTRLMADSPESRLALLDALVSLAKSQDWSSLHLLFAAEEDLQTCRSSGWLSRHTVQFHWNNNGFTDFEDFLGHMSQEKRKKIRQERRKVAQAGVVFRALQGQEIQNADWDFFYECYERTYLEHGNAPYLNRDFFQRMQLNMPQNWLLFVASRGGQDMACSLVGLNNAALQTAPSSVDPSAAYGRYWGALERVDCLHFEACYYQPIAWCIAHGIGRFEGGAQGEHKMARALLPVKASSAHWLAHPAFSDAVERYLEKEGQGVEAYLENLEARSPLRPASKTTT